MNTDTSIRYGLHAAGLVCSIIVLIVGYLVGYVPRMVESQMIGAERARIEKMTSAIPDVQDGNSTLSAECEALEKELEALVEGVPRVAREHELLKSFSELADKCEMKLLDFTPSPAGKEGDLGVTSVQMGFRGDYDSTCMLLWEIDNMKRLHRISSVSIRPVDRTMGVFEIRFEMRAFYGNIDPNSTTQGSAA